MRRHANVQHAVLSIALFSCFSWHAHGLTEYLADHIIPMHGSGDLDRLIDDASGHRLVLLGEASHGTHEFYVWRADISKRLIKEKGYSFIAVEGDWASIYRLNDYVKARPGAAGSAREVLASFDRWPEWMWGNTAIEDLAEWLRTHNDGLDDSEKVGVFGMDVYGHWEAVDDLLAFAADHLPDQHGAISERLACFASDANDTRRYAQSIASGAASCEEELAEVIALLRDERARLEALDQKRYFRAKQNALVVQNAEAHVRWSVRDRAQSWNSRATHMWVTVQRLIEVHGGGSKGIVWAHNTHVGDARATPMAGQNMVNIGMMSRRDLGADAVFILGFGTYAGRVNAGRSWEAPMEIMSVPEAIPGSFEHIFRQFEPEVFYLPLRGEDIPAELHDVRGHRAIGVVYQPENERGNYVPTVFPERYDGFLFIRHTRELTPVG